MLTSTATLCGGPAGLIRAIERMPQFELAIAVTNKTAVNNKSRFIKSIPPLRKGCGLGDQFPSFCSQAPLKPIDGKPHDLFQFSRPLEQICRAGYDLRFPWRLALQPGRRNEIGGTKAVMA
jgi:hypothetical protein